MTFYERLKLVLDSRGVSTYKVSKDIGIDNATFTKWKKNGSSPNVETLKKLCDYLKVSSSYLIGEVVEIRRRF